MAGPPTGSRGGGRASATRRGWGAATPSGTACPWKPVGVAVFLLVFVVPFVGLLGVRPKKYPPALVTLALVTLTGIWLERYLEIVPSINDGAGPAIGLPEVGVTLLFGGLFLLSFGWFGARYPMLSPRLAADTLERERH